MRGLPIAAATLGLVLSPACAPRYVALPVPAPEPSHAGPVLGEVAFMALPDTRTPRPRLPEDVQISPPSLQRAEPLPAYPPRALQAAYGDATTVVRIIIGIDGRVTQVGDSPLADEYPDAGGPFSSEFRAAVEEAVRQWVFNPARADKVAMGEDFDRDGRPDYLKVVATEWISVYVDLRFDFRVVDGKGEARLAPPVTGSPPPASCDRTRRSPPPGRGR